MVGKKWFGRDGGQGEVFRARNAGRGTGAQAPALVARRSDRTVEAPCAAAPVGTGQGLGMPLDAPKKTGVVSAPGGRVALSDAQRSHCVVFEDGRFLVHATYLGDNDLLNAVQRAAVAAGVKLKPAEPVGFEDIRKHYNETATLVPSVGKMRARVSTLLERAAESRVSDIQIIPDLHAATVQFQVNGFLTKPDKRDEIHLDDLNNLYTAVHHMAQHGDPIRNRHMDQRITITNRNLLPGVCAGARVQWVPAGQYQHMNIRLLYEKLPTAEPSLRGLDIPEEIRSYLYFLLTHSNGIFTIAGPTESGKSFTQTCWMLSLIDRHGRTLLVVSLADPPEGYYPGIVPYGINTEEDQAGVSIVDRLTRATLRVSPHYVNFAEIRTPLMAGQAVIASTQGKFILATLHTEDCLGIPNRYVKLGVDFSDAFAHTTHAAMVAQRLVPHLCPRCSIFAREVNAAGKDGAYQAADLSVYRAALGDIADTLKVRGPGCKHCVNPERISIPGLMPRRLYMELARPDARLFARLRKDREGSDDGTPLAREYWFKDMGAKSMRLYALADLIAGKIGMGEFTYFFGSPYALRDDMALHPEFAHLIPRVTA